MIEEVWKDYIEIVIPKLYSWLSIPAHGLKYRRKGSGERYPEQTMFWHVINSVRVGAKLLDYFDKQGAKLVDNPRELFTFATLHDLNKVLGLESEKDLTFDDIEEAYQNLGLVSYCPSADLQMIHKLIECSHAAKHTQRFDEYLGDIKFSDLLRLHFLMDGLATIQSPREAYIVKGKQDRSCYEWFTDITSHHYELIYHEIGLVIGFLTNALNSTIAEYFQERIERCHPILYFPNGVVYVAPKGAFDDYWAKSDLMKVKTEVINELANSFYRKFLHVIESTEQIVMQEKGQASPAPYSFLFNIETLTRAVKNWTLRRLATMRSLQSQLEILSAQPKHSKKEENKLKSLQKRIDTFFEKLEKNQLPKLQEKVNGGLKLNTRQKIELKILSDLLAYFMRLAEKVGLEEKVYKAISKVTEVDLEKLTKLKIKTSGGVNFRAILASLDWQLSVQSATSNEPKTLSVLEQARLKRDELEKKTVERIIDSISTEIQEVFKTLKKSDYEHLRRRALLEAEILADESILEPEKLEDPVEKSLLEDLGDIIREYLEFKPIKIKVNDEEHSIISRFGADPFIGQNFCNFCGRVCKGIKVTAKMTIVETPTYYSNYNWLQSVEEEKPRRICSACFFENILRSVLYPKKGPQNKSLNVFIFPEYAFTPFGADIFKKQAKDRFPKIEEEESTEENQQPSYFLKSIQYVLRNVPTIIEGELAETVISPLTVVPLSSDDNLKSWIVRTRELLRLRSNLGLKYLLTTDFYPEIESVEDVKGAIELKGAHPMLQTRMKRWIMSLREQPLPDIPETVFSIKEAEKIDFLMQKVQEISQGMKDGETKFYTDHLSFAAMNTLSLASAKKKKTQRRTANGE